MSQFHTIIGMPSSGKTTFLAALWHLITSGELKSSLSLERLDGDYHYLNQLVETWQKCERLPRTSLAQDNAIALHLKESQSGKLITLDFADLSGEIFHSQFANRLCTPGYLAGLNGNGGIMLFVNADRPHQAVTIMDARGLLDGASEGETEWTPHFVSEQAQLVDLLQCMQRAPFEVRLRRLTVIVSAWDVVSNNSMTPKKWLETEMPFLAQFLRSNPMSFQTEIFGVSAQGGVVEGISREELLKKIPSTRIRCVSGSTESSDITVPLKWLSGANGE
jgi:hypothetical protein